MRSLNAGRFPAWFLCVHACYFARANWVHWRLAHHAIVIITKDKSYRMRNGAAMSHRNDPVERSGPIAPDSSATRGVALAGYGRIGPHALATTD